MKTRTDLEKQSGSTNPKVPRFPKKYANLYYFPFIMLTLPLYLFVILFTLTYCFLDSIMSMTMDISNFCLDCVIYSLYGDEAIRRMNKQN